MKINTRFATRLASLRNAQNMSQMTLAEALADYTGREKSFAPSTISMWEVGKKTPDLPTIVALSSFFGVSVDYMLGLTSNPGEGGTTVDNHSTEDGFNLKESMFRISKEEILQYDGFPVYVVFPQMDYKNQWGIVNVKTSSIVFKEYAIKYSTFVGEYYTYPRPSDVYYEIFKSHPYSERQLMLVKKFWIEIISNSYELRSQYSGWWQHNETHTGIVKPSNGLVLPYDGLGISYRAYNSPLTK